MPEHHQHHHHGGHHGGNQHIDIHIDTHEKRGADCMDIFLSFFLPPVAIIRSSGSVCFSHCAESYLESSTLSASSLGKRKQCEEDIEGWMHE
uniref:Uncharacterized protein n=1 Tax=Nelumbo nucifera TaxID=4432 RepID=A0A822ZFT9_NELNU|nr:TPA_asm: hypothetical protein HUJ06_001600 [Nelumbo nucifera]